MREYPRAAGVAFLGGGDGPAHAAHRVLSRGRPVKVASQATRNRHRERLDPALRSTPASSGGSATREQGSERVWLRHSCWPAAPPSKPAPPSQERAIWAPRTPLPQRRANRERTRCSSRYLQVFYRAEAALGTHHSLAAMERRAQ